ncbi:MAG: hypothetical protein M1828_005099 [Chrysothrix sp. TS-e1954]|nr:MAG: hypothetical protein M1828_005099 [Chrysothrix sp. TS-e1954]
MSATRNTDATNATANQEGQVGSHVPRSEQQTTHGHKPGVLTGNDAVPEHHVQAMPAGTAPSDRTFQPQNVTDVPGQAGDNHAAEQNEPGTTTAASATLGGSSSADVHTGLGHPGQGMSSAEARHDGGSHRGAKAGGLQGVGASGAGHADQQKSTGKRVDDV